jgi:hypothetical protein
MVKEVKMYTLICDGCGQDFCEGSEFAAWGEPDFVIDAAHEEDWIESEEKDYCPDCYTYDDQDKLIIKNLPTP